MKFKQHMQIQDCMLNFEKEDNEVKFREETDYDR